MSNTSYNSKGRVNKLPVHWQFGGHKSAYRKVYMYVCSILLDEDSIHLRSLAAYCVGAHQKVKIIGTCHWVAIYQIMIRGLITWNTKDQMLCHSGHNNRVIWSTFINPSKPKVRPGAREKSVSSPAQLATPAMNVCGIANSQVWNNYMYMHSNNLFTLAGDVCTVCQA